MEFLGNIVSPEGLQMDCCKVQAIMDWEFPKEVKALQRYLGFANFYWKVIKGLPHCVAPLTALLKQGGKFLWTPPAQEVLEGLKTTFSSAPILVHPDPDLLSVLEAYLSTSAIGAILSHYRSPCAYYSRHLTPVKCDYTGRHFLSKSTTNIVDKMQIQE